MADIACGTSYGLPELTQIAQAVVLVMVLGQADVPRIGNIAMLINVLLP